MLGADGVLLLKFIRDKSGPIASNEVFREVSSLSFKRSFLFFKSKKIGIFLFSVDFSPFLLKICLYVRKKTLKKHFVQLWMKYKSYKAAPSFHSWDYGDYVDYNNLREAHLTVE